MTLMDDTEFEGMRKMLYKKNEKLNSSVIGIERRQLEIISEADEDDMWEKSILGIDTSEKHFVFA